MNENLSIKWKMFRKSAIDIIDTWKQIFQDTLKSLLNLWWIFFKFLFWHMENIFLNTWIIFKIFYKQTCGKELDFENKIRNLFEKRTCGKCGKSIPPLFPFLRLSCSTKIIFHLWPKSDLFLTVGQFEGEALEELMHQKLFTTPTSCGVLKIIFVLIKLLLDHDDHNDHDASEALTTGRDWSWGTVWLSSAYRSRRWFWCLWWL